MLLQRLCIKKGKIKLFETTSMVHSCIFQITYLWAVHVVLLACHAWIIVAKRNILQAKPINY